MIGRVYCLCAIKTTPLIVPLVLDRFSQWRIFDLSRIIKGEQKTKAKIEMIKFTPVPCASDLEATLSPVPSIS